MEFRGAAIWTTSLGARTLTALSTHFFLHLVCMILDLRSKTVVWSENVVGSKSACLVKMSICSKSVGLVRLFDQLVKNRLFGQETSICSNCLFSQLVKLSIWPKPVYLVNLSKRLFDQSVHLVKTGLYCWSIRWK